MTKGGSLKNRIAVYDKVEDRIAYVTDFIFQFTQLDCLAYLNKTLYFDMLTYDVDRHFGNLALIYKDYEWKEAPLFDFGASFFSLKHVFPDTITVEAKIAKMTPQPFSLDFEVQAFAMGETILKFDYNKIRKMLDEKPEDVLSESMKELVWNRMLRYRHLCEL